MPEAKPPLVVEFVWKERLRFDATSGSLMTAIDADGEAGPSPMQSLAFAVGGCMAADVVAILQKGRHGLTGLRLSLAADRAAEHPRRFTHVALTFHLRGAVPADAAERAIGLSREKYCSALLSLREDIAVDIKYDIEP